MERTLKTHCILLTLLILVGCRHYGTLTSPFAGPYNYETYGPIKESLSFINDSVCIYRQYSMFDKCTIYINDTIGWRYETPHSIDLYRSNNTADSSLNIYADSLINGNLNFTYDICPKWYNMTDEDFYGYNDYKHPFLDDPVSRPNRKDSGIPFYIKYGFNHPVDSDKIGNAGKCMLWLKEPVSKYGITPLFPTGGRIPWRRGKIDREIIKDLSEWILDSYEYINYKVNYERKVEFATDSILGKQFSYLADSCKKESVHFINDSICMHVASKRQNATSPYMPIAMDTCRYTTKNNLIAIDFYKDSPCDTLTYGNGILFYSKVYQDPRNKKYTHIVKPFIDENVKWENKSDSINMIMSTYFNVYVPINLFPCLEEH